jgi:hypothetical protein
MRVTKTQLSIEMRIFGVEDVLAILPHARHDFLAAGPDVYAPIALDLLAQRGQVA